MEEKRGRGTGQCAVHGAQVCGALSLVSTRAYVEFLHTITAELHMQMSTEALSHPGRWIFNSHCSRQQICGLVLKMFHHSSKKILQFRGDVRHCPLRVAHTHLGPGRTSSHMGVVCHQTHGIHKDVSLIPTTDWQTFTVSWPDVWTTLRGWVLVCFSPLTDWFTPCALGHMAVMCFTLAQGVNDSRRKNAALLPTTDSELKKLHGRVVNWWGLQDYTADPVALKYDC